MKVDVEALAQQIADGAWAQLGPKIDALKADHDAHRRQLQARNTELVEELRTAKEELAHEFKKRLAAELDLEDLEDKVIKLHRDTLANIEAGKSAFTACGWCGHASGTLEESRAHVLGCEKNPPVAAFAVLRRLADAAVTAIDGLVFRRQEDGTVQVTHPERWGPVVGGLDELRRMVRGTPSQRECECGCTVPGCRSCGNAPHTTPAGGDYCPSCPAPAAKEDL